MPSKRECQYRDIAFKLFIYLESLQPCYEGCAQLEEAEGSLLESLQASLSEEPSLLVQTRKGFLFINGVRIPVSGETFAAVGYLVRAFHSKGVSGFLISHGLGKDDLQTIVEVLKVERSEADLHLSASEHVQFLAPDSTTTELQSFESGLALTTAAPRETYFKSIFVVQHLWDHQQVHALVDLSVARDLLQCVAEFVVEDSNVLSWLDRYEKDESGLFTHVANVCVYASLIAQQLQVPRTLMAQIGAAGLLHEVGQLREFAAVPESLPTSANENCAETKGRLGFRRLVCQEGGLTDLKMRAALACYSQQPDVVYIQPPGLLESIVCLADRFDELNSTLDMDHQEIAESLLREAERRTFSESMVHVLLDALATPSLATAK